jgi:hypothetical protein
MNDLQKNVSNFNVVDPLLLNYTPKTKIQEESNPFVPLYDDEKQIIYNMRMMGTKSLRQVSTVVKKTSTTKHTTGDRKNEIDDSKNVK